jgi:peptidoglycan/xylan/chitin deacetylase (PgdA/CDA1 family)
MHCTRASKIRLPATLATLAAIGVAVLALAADGSARASDGQRRSTQVPILMYHELGAAPAGAPYPELYVREADFRAQLRWLGRRGYHAVTLRAVWEHWHGGRRLPRRPIVISFDDGFRSTATVALPALRAHGWPAVLNLALHHLDVRWGLWSRDVRAMLANGWELASHTLTHPDLTGVGDSRLEHEVAGSRRVLARRFNVPVDFFCYPAGRYDLRVAAQVEQAGYLGATTTVDGLAHPDEAYALRRLRVSRSDGVAGLVSTLADLQTG